MENSEKPTSLAEARKKAKEMEEARKEKLKQEKDIVKTLESGEPLSKDSVSFQKDLRNEWDDRKKFKVGEKKPFPTKTTDNKKGLIKKIIEIMETREEDLPMDWLRGKELEFRVISKRND